MNNRNTWDRYRAFVEAPPRDVLEWVDPSSGARGWLVINSLRGGAAGGGTRMRAGLGPQEVVYLAKTMELKFAFAGPPIGGAKSGIDFDPTDDGKPQVLSAWFEHIAPYLRECYGTAGDLNVGEISEVMPHCRKIGLRVPQEGIVHGHLRPETARLERILDVLEQGIGAPLPAELGVRGRQLQVSDVAAGYGLARAIARLYETIGEDLEGARAIIEGFGCVGASCALFLARAGARIVAVSDAEKMLVDQDGMTAQDVEELLSRQEQRNVPDDERCVYRAEETTPPQPNADIFVAAALSNMIDRERLDRLSSVGVSVIACGANHPFRESSLGQTEVQRYADSRFSIVPDTVGSAGSACVYSYLMRDGAVPEPYAILESVDDTIGSAMEEIVARGDEYTGLLEASVAVALDRIES